MGNGQPRLIAGAMSGTSADGVDVAITRITGRGLDMRAELVHHHHRPYDAELRGAIFKLRDTGQTSLSDLARLGREISLTYALTVNEALSAANLKSTDLVAVAAHGQTLYHAPPDTIQWLDPALIAAEVGCAVVSDFRRADCAAGGQGAPLVPFADYILFRHPTKNRVLLNIGGIANITVLKAGGAIANVIAFDSGPGNCISDWACRMHGPFGLSWDVDGVGASRGLVLEDVAGRFMASPYLASAPPKSTDGPSMIRLFEDALGAARPKLNDLLATAAYLTAATVQRSIASVTDRADQIVVSGGGLRNKAIMKWLKSLLGSDTQFNTTDDLGLSAEAKEAVAFALLAAATLDGVPSNVPSVTGAERAVVLGSVTPRP
jgi:anhydro-N-acetylmuramic acid kinase